MKIAISACLLGEKVRFDGGHKRDRFITDQLQKFASFLPFCPEAKAFGTPRPSLRLIAEQTGTTLRCNKTHNDLTENLRIQNEKELSMLQTTPLSGIIFKSKSPSCGFGSAKIYLPNGFSEGKDDGLFVRTCKEAFPLLPMEEESRLQDPWLRENFIMQLFAYDRFEQLKASLPTMQDLVRFHTASKFLLQAKNEVNYRTLGNIVANHDKEPFHSVLERYEYLYKKTIAVKSSLKKTRNVLEHMAGFFKKELHSVEKEMVHLLIQEYAQGIIPLITPVSAILMLAKKYDTRYLLDQYFLEPYPKSLALRSSLGSER